WCGPCLEEMPRFIELQTRFADQGVQFIGIGIDQAEPLRKIVDRLGVNYPVLQGDFEAMEVAKKFGNTYGVLPYTSILNQKGELIHEIAGGVKPGEMEALIIRLLNL
ncbi:MAG: TlpA family protein disulfide reductase, partial [Immundisolibacteraceae bacterium]|nr:TlpA family protein disulfide reductase [Immundisolibacteraceae bacterium]